MDGFYANVFLWLSFSPLLRRRNNLFFHSCQNLDLGQIDDALDYFFFSVEAINQTTTSRDIFISECYLVAILKIFN